MFPLAVKIVAATFMREHPETPGRRGPSVPTAPEALPETLFQPKTAANNEITVCGTTIAFSLQQRSQALKWIGLIS